MSLFPKQYISSAMSGTVIQNGNPVEGAQVTQRILWKSKDEVPESQITTKADGTFHFPTITRNWSPLLLLPGEITIVQHIDISYQGKEYVGWINTKRNYDLYGETGKPLNFICDLNHTPTNTGNDFGICRII